MSVSGISSTSFFDPSVTQGIQDKKLQFQKELQQLSQDLKVGNLAASQADFVALQKLGGFASPISGGSPRPTPSPVLGRGDHDPVPSPVLGRGDHDPVPSPVLGRGDHDPVPSPVLGRGDHDPVPSPILGRGGPQPTPEPPTHVKEPPTPVPPGGVHHRHPHDYDGGDAGTPLSAIIDHLDPVSRLGGLAVAQQAYSTVRGAFQQFFPAGVGNGSPDLSALSGFSFSA